MKKYEACAILMDFVEFVKSSIDYSTKQIEKIENGTATAQEMECPVEYHHKNIDRLNLKIVALEMAGEALTGRSK